MSLMHPPLRPLRKAGLILMMLSLCGSACKKRPKPSRPLRYEITTADIDHFWAAYDALKYTEDSVETLQKLYIDKATPAFKKFLAPRHFSAAQYVDWLKGAPDFWRTVRPLTLAVKDQRAAIDKLYRKMAELYPDFQAPDICFAISPIGTGGTTDKGLILIGTEIAAVNPDKVDIAQVGGFMHTVFQNSSGDVIATIAHELVHTQQPGGDNQNESLLSQAITEGAADFIAVLLGHPSMDKTRFKYGQRHERALWAEFYRDVQADKGFDQTDWFYDYHSKRPADLGYYLGYEIVKAYYDRQTDKKQAIKVIITIEDAKAFLAKSGYSG